MVQGKRMGQKIFQKLHSFAQNFLLFSIGKYVRLIKKPKLPQNQDGKVLIHIGCGEYNDPRYINVDTRPGFHIHYADSIENVDHLFSREYADLIYACHVLEHVPYAKTSAILRKLHWTLKEGGVLRFSVPNFEVLVKMYEQEKKLEDILPPLMGGQGYAENFHYTAFDEAYLRKLLLEAGFREVRLWDPDIAPFLCV